MQLGEKRLRREGGTRNQERSECEWGCQSPITVFNTIAQRVVWGKIGNTTNKGEFEGSGGCGGIGKK